MLKNYLAVALRNLGRNKGYAFINVAGLAVGLACFILILLFIEHELSYDRFHENADRIHRVVQRQPGNVFLGSDYFAVTPAPLASTLIQEYPEVSAATTVSSQDALLIAGDERFWEEGIWADAGFFDVFPFDLKSGRPEAALAEPGSIVLTERLAEKIFGEEDPVGQTLLHQNRDTYTVTGVMEDVPENSTLRFDFVTTLLSHSNYMSNLAKLAWKNNSWHTFFTLAPGADAADLQAKMPALIAKYVADEDDDPAAANQYFVQPLSDIHLRSTVNFDMGVRGNIKYVYLFAAIAVVILLLACVNYMNLAVARSIKRTREVGMRKVVGAERSQLVAQFLGESWLMTSIAAVLAILLVQLLLPMFGELVKRPLAIKYTGLFLATLFALAAVVGLVSGSYPAIFMASLRPIQVLKGATTARVGRFTIHRLLIVGQYAASIALVAGSLVIYQQLRFVQEKELGYDREHVLTVTTRDRGIVQNYSAIRDEWLRQAGVSAVTSSDHLPTNIGSSTTIQGWEGSSDDDEVIFYHWSVDYDFLDVFGIDLVAGRTFSREVAGDTLAAFVINQTAARAMGWTPEEAVGRHFNRSETQNRIIGVVKDFHLHSLHLPIEPLMIRLGTDPIGYISARVKLGDLSSTIARLETSVRRFTPYPFEYQFLDENFDELYETETRLGKTFGFFTVLAMLIASLGLFGLAAFSAEQRTKEVGIRRVLGASSAELATLLSKDFLGLVVIAFVIATPLAYYAMHRWLEEFAYRIELGPAVFVLSGALAVGIALLTVSYQAVRAATADPVKSLRYE